MQYILNRMHLALDVQEMRSVESDFARKKKIYEEGENAFPLTLQDLSKGAALRWPLSPMFNLYQHAFTVIGDKQEHDTLGFFDGSPAVEYADRLVVDLFDLQIDRVEAEGAVIYNVMMAFWSVLSDVMNSCWAVAEGGQDATLEYAKMDEYIDQAAAFWVGQDQVRGDTSTGYMLYNLAQTVGERFNQDNEGSEVKINRDVMELFVGLQAKIQKQECQGIEGYINMRKEVQLLIKYSNVVLVQMLLHRVEEDNARKADLVEMYALAIIPQIATCDQNAYDILLRNVVTESIETEAKTNIIKAIQSVYSCLHIDCKLVGAYEGDRIPLCDDSAEAGLPSLTEYQPTTDVRIKSYIDRDISQIRVFLELGAFQNAQDLYEFGWNSDGTLQDMNENSANTVVDQFLRYTTDEKYFPDNMIEHAFERTSPFENASATQRASLIMGVVQSTSMYWAVAQQLNLASVSCTEGRAADALVFWDTAAAYAVGSIEGQNRDGQEGGQLMFAMTKQFCGAFGTCEPGSSVDGRDLIISLITGQELLQNNECPELEALLQTGVYPSLLVPLIQGTIWYASQEPKDDTVDSAASVLAFSRAILPAINAANPPSAETISANTAFFFEPTTALNFESISLAFTDALDLMETDCDDIGRIQVGAVERGFCVGDVAVTVPTTPVPAPVATAAPVTNTTAPSPVPGNPPTSSPVADSAPTSSPQTSSPVTERTIAPVHVPEPHPDGIAWGRYTFSNDDIADRDSSFSLDVKGMHNAETPTIASLIYNQTSMNVPTGLSSSGGVLSLADFSRQASAFMSEDPMYNFYRVALYDDASFDDEANADGWPFGHSVVELALGPSNGNDQVLGAKAAVVMNVWMLITSRLYDSVRECKAGRKPVELIDSAVALWIGQEQGMGRFNSGWMMYSVAQEAAELYGNEEGEARVNTELMTVFNAAKERANLCDSSNESGFLRLRFLVDEIVNLLSVPLLQSLLYYISVDDFEYVELFSLAFAPQAIACNEGTYNTLKDTLYQEFKREDLTDAFISKLTEVFVCLDMTCEDLGDVSNANAILKSLVDGLCTRLSDVKDNPKLANYNVTNKFIDRIDRLDLDLHQMDLFMRTKAYDLAADVFEFGRNSIHNEEVWNSVGKLTGEIEILGPGDLFDIYSDYFKSPQYASETILATLEAVEDGRFAGASRRQLSEVALRSSQALVSFMLVLGKLRDALNHCEAGTGGQLQLDEAAALFVGSMEGPTAGGDKTKNGKMLFALAKEVCEAFGKCESDGDASSNEVIMFALSDMKMQLDAASCSTARSILETTIMPMIQVPLIQGTLYFANQNVALEAQAAYTSLAAGDILAMSIVPLVNAFNKESAAVILDNTEFSRSEKPVKGGVPVVFDAFATVLAGLGIDCDTVGRIGDLSTCPIAPTPPDTPTNLGDDLYVTTTYVQDRANIAKDINGMNEELQFGNKDQALLIYEEGRNSEIFDNRGIRTGLRSFSSFSTNASQTNPLYTIAVYALRDERGEYLGRDAWLYADTIVKEALTTSRLFESTLAAEAAIILNLWMELANELFSTVRRCKANNVKDDDGVRSIDEAVAYWIGDGQIGGDPKRGHLLYALAELIGEQFGLDESGQSRTNVNILRLFHQAKIELSLPGACAESATAYRVQHIVNKIVTQMVTVTVQALVHYLRMDDRDRVSVYAHAFVPLVASCSPDAFSYLRSTLLDGPFPEAELEDIIQTIYSTFPCFGMQCDDVGVHKLETTSSCTDPALRPHLAGYTPFSDVREYAQLDLDILEIDILMEMEAYDAAYDLYTFGKHVPTIADQGRTALSLQYLAKRTSRSDTKEIQAFKRYFSNDENYADSLVQSVLLRNTNGYSKEQRRVIATGVCRYMVMFAAVLLELDDAIKTCESGYTENTPIVHWDIAAAYITGHLEGTKERGSNEGILFWGLAKENCAEFNTCSSGSAVVNDRINTILYAGRGAILGANCRELRRAASELIPLLETSLIQAALSSTSKLSTRSGANNETLQAQAYVYALSVLPLINEVNRAAATTISANLNIGGPPLADGAAVVAYAFSSSMPGLGVDCANVGVSDQINSCTGDVKTSNAGLIAGIIIGCVAAFGLCFLMFRRRKSKAKSEERVEFISSKGELNHNTTCTDLIPAEQPASRHDAETDFLKGNDADAIEDEDEDYNDFLKGNDADAIEDEDEDYNDDDDDEDPDASEHSNII
jgi:hypothetical protein